MPGPYYFELLEHWDVEDDDDAAKGVLRLTLNDNQCPTHVFFFPLPTQDFFFFGEGNSSLNQKLSKNRQKGLTGRGGRPSAPRNWYGY